MRLFVITILAISSTSLWGKKVSLYQLNDEYWKNPEQQESVAPLINDYDDFPEHKKCQKNSSSADSRDIENLFFEIIGITKPLIASKEVYADSWYISCFRCQFSQNCQMLEENDSTPESNFYDQFVLDAREKICQGQALSYVMEHNDLNGNHDYKYDFAHCVTKSFDICPSNSISSQGGVNLHPSCYKQAKNLKEMELLYAKSNRLLSIAKNHLSGCTDLPLKTKQWMSNGFIKFDLLTCLNTEKDPLKIADPERIGLYHISLAELLAMSPHTFEKREIKTFTVEGFFTDSEVRRYVITHTSDVYEAAASNLKLSPTYNLIENQNERVLVQKVLAAIISDMAKHNEKIHDKSQFANYWAEKCLAY
jgi:hypothetical protein